jgi:probable selenium-dependent hydroxylase accessory protein YqeC
MGADAFVNPLETVAHRVDRITALTGLTGDDVITPEDAATILLNPNGGLKAIPETARVVMTITKVAPDNIVHARSLGARLEAHPRVNRCLTLNLS